MTPPAAANATWDFVCRHRIWLLGGLAALAVADVAWAALTYLVYPGYLDHGEPSVALISWRLLDGAPAYPAFDQPGRVTNVYGPMTYLMHALSFLVAGPSVASGKAASVIAAMLAPVLLFLDHRRHGFVSGASAAIIAAGFVLLNLPVSVWNRPDAFIVVLAAVAIWAKNASVPGRPEWGRTLLIGVCGGLAVGLKIHAGIFLAPVALAHCMDPRRGIRSFLAIFAAGATVALWPFALPPFTLVDYLSWFGPLMGKPSPLSLMQHLFRYTLLYILPFVYFAYSQKPAERMARLADGVYLGAYFGATAAAIYIGSKPGAGVHYLLPLFPMTVDLVLSHGRRIRKRRIAWLGIAMFAAITLAISVPVQKRFHRALHWDDARRITAEVREIMEKYPGRTIEMGVGNNVSTYWKTYYKSLLVLADHPYTVDAAVAMETTYLGIPLTDDTLSMIRGCNTDLWLIPKGERPFAMIGYYGKPTVTAAFVRAFEAAYVKERSFDFFDVWGCRQ